MHLKKKISIIGITTLIVCLSKVYAINTSIIGRKTISDIANYGKHNTNQIRGSISILDLISLVNSYLWFAIGFFCFVFMIWNGYKLIMANGDSKSMDSAKKALLGSAIGLAVCLLAYIIVNLAVKLFA